jgi:hypothetical protein
MLERREMNAREWYIELNSQEQKAFEAIAKYRLRMLIGDEAEEYFQRSFLYWWESNKQIAYFRPGLVVLRAYFMYVDDIAEDRLDYVGDLACGEESDEAVGTTSFPDLRVNVEKDVSNRALLATMREVLSDKQVEFLTNTLHHGAYNYDGDGFDNITLADDLGVDVRVVQNFLDSIRRRLKRHGFSKG